MRAKELLFRYALQSIAIVLIVATLIRVFLVSSYVNSGYSMLPSIWPGEFLIGTKQTGTLKRGDIVILRCPNSKDRICMKRVVGLPGDRIEYKNSLLEINGKTARYKPVSSDLHSESIAGSSWLIWPETFKGLKADKLSVVVPPHHLYLLNDKRTEPEDSRIWGPVDENLVEARAVAIWLSLDWFEGDEVRSWPRVRWARLFRSIY